MAIDGHGRREPLPLLSRAYIRPQGTSAPPSHTPKLPCLRFPWHALATAWSIGRHAIAAARASSPSVTPPSPPFLTSSSHWRLTRASIQIRRVPSASNRARFRRLRIPAAGVDRRRRSLSPTEASTCGEEAFPHPLFVSPKPRMPPPLVGGRPSAPFGAMPRPPLKPPVQAPH
jgi:hypothetical protein